MKKKLTYLPPEMNVTEVLLENDIVSGSQRIGAGGVKMEEFQDGGELGGWDLDNAGSDPFSEGI